MTWLRPLLFFAALLAASPLRAQPALVRSVGWVDHGAASQLVLDFASGRAEAAVTHGPAHVVIRLKNARLAGALRQPSSSHPLLRRLKLANVSGELGLEAELKRPASVRSHLENRGSRLVVDLQPAAQAQKAISETRPVRSPVAESGTRSPQVRRAPPARERVIAIDAGHGGKDTGAIGPGGTLEKNVVFAVARRLEALIRAEPGMRPVMVRHGDQFIDLRQRADLARRARADLFVSIHADAYVNAEAKGSSVFTLSPHGASNVAARWLADRANAADLVGGVKLRDKDKLLASVLLDLSQGATQESSDRAALRILGELEKNHHLHHRDVQKAGFVVLMSPDMPSLLVETAFISNPREEQSLRSAQHQDRLARSIFAGIRRHFSRNGQTLAKAGDSVLLAAQP